MLKKVKTLATSDTTSGRAKAIVKPASCFWRNSLQVEDQQAATFRPRVAAPFFVPRTCTHSSHLADAMEFIGHKPHRRPQVQFCYVINSIFLAGAISLPTHVRNTSSCSKDLSYCSRLSVFPLFWGICPVWWNVNQTLKVVWSVSHWVIMIIL